MRARQLPTRREMNRARNRPTALLCAAALIATVAVVVPATPAAAATAAPTAVLDVPADTFIGESIAATLTFDNAATTAVGYGPYVDLFTASTGADGDDGVSFSSATFAGSPVASQTITLACDGSDAHPLTGLAIGCPAGIAAGDTVTVLTLPFGSFTPTQPAVEIDLGLSVSPLADLGVPLVIAAVAGFRFGQTPDDDPGTDPPIVQATPATATVTPTVVRVAKTLSAPESETATGENFPRRWTVTAEIAPGQTVTDLILTDRLEDSVAFEGVGTVSAGGVVLGTPAPGVPSAAPDNEVAVQWASASGTVSFEFDFHIPRDDASGAPVLDPATGAARSIDNDVAASGVWTPLDPRDAATPLDIDPPGPESRITARSLAIHKTVAVVTDTGATGPSPGDTLEWTLNVSVSDYFTFDDVTIEDLLSDGQSLDPLFTPTLAVTTVDGSLNPVPGAEAFMTASTNGCGAAEPGAIALAADLSGALAAGIPATLGVFTGGDGVGATTATLRFRSVIDADYRCPVGAPAVNSDDRITNDVTVTGTLVPLGVTVSDSSSARVEIVAPDVTKSVYAVNGDTADPGTTITPGDLVTYRLRAALPITNSFNTSLTDFFPLPTFEIPGSGFTADFGAPVAPGPFSPTPWSIRRGADDTFTGTLGVIGADPTVSVDPVGNALTIDYPDYQAAAGDAAAVIDLLVTVVAASTRFADGLFLTNLVQFEYSDSVANAATDLEVVQVELTEPRLAITKGVVATDRTTGATFTPSAVGPPSVSWSAPGSPGTRFSGGNLTSAALAAHPVSSSISGVDAADTVTFAIAVENFGSGANGAFDVTITDSLPSGLEEPAGGWNLTVTTGDGTPLGFSTIAGGGPLGGGVVLDDGVSTGSLASGDAADGSNVAVITFDAVLADDARFASSYTNTAAVTNYSATEGGPNFVTSPVEDTATANTANPSITKAITGTQMVPGVADDPTRSTLTIGSLVSYDVTVTVPEGTADAFVLRDTLDAGLALVSLDGISASPALSTSNPGGFPGVLADATVLSVGSGAAAPGRRVDLPFGTLTNNDTDNATAETITVSLTAVVINVAANTRNSAQQRRNTAQVLIGGTAAGPSVQSPAFTIVEPSLSTTKTPSVPSADAGDTITYTITVSALASPRTSNAYEVTLNDVLPAGVTLVPGSFAHVGGTAPTTIDEQPSELNATWATFAPGATATFTYSVTVNSNAASLAPAVSNTARAAWTSQPGTPASASPHNTLGVERTGDTADVGGTANNYRANATANVTVNSTSVTKALTSTSAGHTAGTQVTIGETATFAITVALPEGELGPVTVTDLLPAGLVFVPGSVTVDESQLDGSLGTTTISTAGNNVVVGFSDVVVTPTPSTEDNIVTVTLTARVADVPSNSNGTTLANVARVTTAGSQFDSDPVTLTVVEPVLTLGKSVSPTAGAVNDTVTYSLTLNNTGGSSAFDVVVADDVDTSLLTDITITSTPPSWSGSVDGSGRVEWVLDAGAPLAPAAPVTFTFTATLTESITVPGSYLNTATTAGSSLPGSPDEARDVDDDGSAELTFTAVDLAVTKVPSVPNAEAGDPITYTIEVSNNGGRDATGVTLVDVLGDHVDFVSASNGGTESGGEVSWPAFNLGSGDSTTRTVTVTVRDPLPVGAVSTVNTVTVTDDGSHGPDLDPDDNSTTATVTLGAAPDIAVDKTAPATSATGATIVYSIEVTNVGTRDAAGVSLVDTLGEHLQFLAASDSGVFDPGTNTVTWPTFALDGGGGTRTFTVTARVAATLPAGVLSVTNSATGSHPDDPNPANDTSTAETDIDAAPDLSITKTDGADTMLTGATTTYQIVVTNLGDRGASGVTVVDELPDEVAFDSADNGGVYDPDARTVTWDLGVVEPAATVTLSLTVTAVDPLPEGTTSVTNTVGVTDDGLNGEDPDPTNNTASDTNRTGADLSVTKELVGDSLTPGATAQYRIVVTNDGPETVSAIVVDDTYPSTLSSPVFAASAGSFDPVTMLWDDLELGPGDSVELRVTFDVDLIATGGITNTVEVQPVGHADPTPGNNAASTTNPAVGVTRLRIDKELTSPLRRGEEATYQITVTNDGPSIATGLVVEDRLPSALTHERSGGDGWSCVPQSGNVVRCAYEEPLPPGEETSFTVVAIVADDAVGQVENVATVSSDESPAAGSVLTDVASGELAALPVRPAPPSEPGSTSTPGTADAARGGRLARTGTDPWYLALLAAGLMSAGLVARIASVTTRRPSRTSSSDA